MSDAAARRGIAARSGELGSPPKSHEVLRTPKVKRAADGLRASSSPVAFTVTFLSRSTSYIPRRERRLRRRRRRRRLRRLRGSGSTFDRVSRVPATARGRVKSESRARRSPILAIPEFLCFPPHRRGGCETNRRSSRLEDLVRDSVFFPFFCDVHWSRRQPQQDDDVHRLGLCHRRAVFIDC